MQKSFFGQKNNYILLLTLLLCIFTISCTQKSFLCWNEEKTLAMAFAYDDIANYVVAEDKNSYSILTSSKEPLQSHMPGGTHVLQMDEDIITLQVIQDTVYTRTQLPSGKFIDSYDEIKTENDYLKQRRYHAVYPVVWKYVFDKVSSELSFFATPLPKPRSAIEQEFIYDKAKDDLYPKKVRDLTDKEAASIFPPNEKEYNDNYPHCEDES